MVVVNSSHFAKMVLAFFAMDAAEGRLHHSDPHNLDPVPKTDNPMHADTQILPQKFPVDIGVGSNHNLVGVAQMNNPMIQDTQSPSRKSEVTVEAEDQGEVLTLKQFLENELVVKAIQVGTHYEYKFNLLGTEIQERFSVLHTAIKAYFTQYKQYYQTGRVNSKQIVDSVVSQWNAFKEFKVRSTRRYLRMMWNNKKYGEMYSEKRSEQLDKFLQALTTEEDQQALFDFLAVESTRNHFFVTLPNSKVNVSLTSKQLTQVAAKYKPQPGSAGATFLKEVAQPGKKTAALKLLMDSFNDQLDVSLEAEKQFVDALSQVVDMKEFVFSNTSYLLDAIKQQASTDPQRNFGSIQIKEQFSEQTRDLRRIFAKMNMPSVSATTPADAIASIDTSLDLRADQYIDGIIDRLAKKLGGSCAGGKSGEPVYLLNEEVTDADGIVRETSGLIVKVHDKTARLEKALISRLLDPKEDDPNGGVSLVKHFQDQFDLGKSGDANIATTLVPYLAVFEITQGTKTIMVVVTPNISRESTPLSFDFNLANHHFDDDQEKAQAFVKKLPLYDLKFLPQRGARMYEGRNTRQEVDAAFLDLFRSYSEDENFRMVSDRLQGADIADALHRDVNFLSSRGAMDYSLAVKLYVHTDDSGWRVRARYGLIDYTKWISAEHCSLSDKDVFAYKIGLSTRLHMDPFPAAPYAKRFTDNMDSYLRHRLVGKEGLQTAMAAVLRDVRAKHSSEAQFDEIEEKVDNASKQQTSTLHGADTNFQDVLSALQTLKATTIQELAGVSGQQARKRILLNKLELTIALAKRSKWQSTNVARTPSAQTDYKKRHHSG